MGGVRIAGMANPPIGLVPFVMYGEQPTTPMVSFNNALFMVSETPGQDQRQISIGVDSLTGADLCDPDPRPDGTMVVASTAPIGASASTVVLLDMPGGPTTGTTVLDTMPSLLVFSMQPSFHPTDPLVVYRTVDNSPNECQIRTISTAPASTPTTLKTISRTLGETYRPQFSASGDFIAYVLDNGTSDIYVMNADGTGATNIATLGSPRPRVGWEFSWARTQDVLVYQKQNGSNVEIRTINADGTGDTLIYTDTHLEFFTNLTRRAWSQDDSTIFKFVRDSGDTDAPYQLYAIDSGGGGGAAVSPQQKTTMFSNDCLPQTYGNRVYYASSDTPPNDDSDHFQVYSLQDDGTDPRLELAYSAPPPNWTAVEWIGAWEGRLNQDE